MQINQQIVWAFSFILCSTASNILKSEHKRVKRWEGTGDMSNMFRGTAGVDYPDLKTIPTTSFRCDDQQYEGGLYADVETQCQVYHVCHDGRKDSFMCGRGTIFNQQILACDYWYSAECDTAPSFYYVNSQIGGSDSSWIPPPENVPYNPPNNVQGNGYQPSNPNNPQAGNQGNSYQPSNPNNPQAGNQGNSYQPSNPNNPQAGNQGNSYQPSNPNNPQAGNQGNSYQPNYPDNVYEQGNRGTSDLTRGGPSDNNQGNNQKPCCCLKNTYQAPWNFPSNLVNPNRKK